MKSNFMIVLCAAAALVGCEQGQDQMNEPSGAERPAYQNPDSSTNTPSAPTNSSGAASERTNDTGKLPGSGTSGTP